MINALFVPRRLKQLQDVDKTLNPSTNDTLRFDGTKWVKATDVISFSGRTGAVVPAISDYTWAQIDKAISSLADITTRSHTALSDIGANAHSVIDSHLASTSSPHGATLTQQNLTITGTFDINNAAPSITLTDTTASATSLKIDVDANVAQIREKNGASNSLLSFDLTNNIIGVFTAPDTSTGVYINKTFTGAGGFNVSLYTRLKFTGDDPTAHKITIYGDAHVSGSGSLTTLQASNFFAYTMGSGTITNATAVFAGGGNYGSGTIVNARGLQCNNPPGTIINKIGVYIERQTGGVTRNYGLYYGADAIGNEPAGNFAIYADSDNSYFGGNVGIGTLPTTTEILSLVGSLTDNLINFGVSGNDKAVILNMTAKDASGNEIRTMFGSSRGGDGFVTVVSNHALTLGTNNIERIQIAANGNLGINGSSFGSGVKVIGIANATTVPTTNPAGGGILYTEAGALKYRGSSGTVTQLAAA